MITDELILMLDKFEAGTGKDTNKYPLRRSGA